MIFCLNPPGSELMEEGAGRVEASVQNQQLAFCLFGALTLGGLKFNDDVFPSLPGSPILGQCRMQFGKSFGTVKVEGFFQKLILKALFSPMVGSYDIWLV